MSVMLYKQPGKHKIHGDTFDYVIVNEDEVEESLNSGWHKTTTEAKDAYSNKDTKRENLTAKANELGIEFDGRTSTDKLEASVVEKIAEKSALESLRII